MLNFNSFIKESSEAPSIVAGSHDHAAKIHKSIIRQAGGVIHKHSENNGVHSIVHSTRSGVMKVSQIKHHTEKNKSVISTRKATDLEKKIHAGKFVVSEKWVADNTKRGTVFPIYENPSSKDLVDLRKSGLTNDLVRFAAFNSNKKIYVWSGMDMIHDDAVAKLRSSKVLPRIQHDNLENALCGECHLIDGRLSFARNDGMDTYFGAIIYTVKSSRVKKDVDSSVLPSPYFELKDLIDDLPSIIEKYKWVGKFIDEYETKSSPALLLQYSKGK